MDRMTATEDDISEDALLRSQSLGRSDWIRAALDALIDKGIDAVKITQLAQRLGVTRGSFYWHFKAREDILSALIDYWQQKNTAVIVRAATQGPDLEDAVLALMEAWVDQNVFDPRLDLAIRSWSRSETPLRVIVQDNDDTRLLALTQMYQRSGRSATEAVVAARNIYFMQMGYFACEIEESLDARLAYLQAYVESYTGKPLSQQRADAFIATIKKRLSQR